MSARRVLPNAIWPITRFIRHAFKERTSIADSQAEVDARAISDQSCTRTRPRLGRMAKIGRTAPRDQCAAIQARIVFALAVAKAKTNRQAVLRSVNQP